MGKRIVAKALDDRVDTSWEIRIEEESGRSMSTRDLISPNKEGEDTFLLMIARMIDLEMEHECSGVAFDYQGRTVYEGGERKSRVPTMVRAHAMEYDYQGRWEVWVYGEDGYPIGKSVVVDPEPGRSTPEKMWAVMKELCEEHKCDGKSYDYLGFEYFSYVYQKEKIT